MVGAGILVEQVLERIERDIDTQVPVDVDVDVEPRPPERLDLGLQLLGWHEPLALVAVDVARGAHLHVLSEHRSVQHEFDALRVDHPPRVHRLIVLKLVGQGGSGPAVEPTWPGNDEGPKRYPLGIERGPCRRAWPRRTTSRGDRRHTAAMDQLGHQGQAVVVRVALP